MDETPNYSYLRPKPRVRWLIALSAAAHVLLLGAMVVATRPSDEDRPKKKVVTVELVRLGKPQPKDALPRMQERTGPKPSDGEKKKNDAQPKSRAKTPPESKTKTALTEGNSPKPKATAAPKDKREASDDALEMLGKFEAETRRPDPVAREGAKPSEDDPEGIENGASTGAARGDMTGLRNTYGARVFEELQAMYEAPPVARELGELRATLRIYIDADGRILKVRIEATSGNEHCDEAMLAFRGKQVSAPPAELRDEIRRHGARVHFVF